MILLQNQLGDLCLVVDHQDRTPLDVGHFVVKMSLLFSPNSHLKLKCYIRKIIFLEKLRCDSAISTYKAGPSQAKECW
jgi:hypothetical protein